MTTERIYALVLALAGTLFLVLEQNAQAVGAAAETLDGVPVGFTEEGFPYRGDPNAPITLEEYSDYLCPFCSRHFQQTLPELLKKYAAGGQLSYVFRDMPLASLHPSAAKGHVAALCVAEQGAALFWKMHDELFLGQRQWNTLPDPGDYLAGAAEKIGADMAAYHECIGSGRKLSFVERSIAAGQELGFNGTPSFRFLRSNGGDETYTLVGAHPLAKFSGWMDALLKGEAPPQPKPPAPAKLPYWADAGLAPDPQRPGYTLAGDQFKGNPDAHLVVVEFTDFQCPSCRRHALETQPVLDKQFVALGDVLWVFKHLPLKEHARAPIAAVAAECAAEQGRFWTMHHGLFEHREQWSGEDGDAALLALAAELGLEQEKFSRCFNSRQALERVLDDLYDAQGMVKTTPTFVMLYDGKGHMLSGARKAEQFAKILQSRLGQAKKIAVLNDNK